VKDFKSYHLNAERCSHGAMSPCRRAQQDRSASTQRGGYNIYAIIFLVYIVVAVAIQSFCCADVTKFATANPSDGGLSAEDRKSLLNASRFHEVHSTRDLPSAILNLCAKDGHIADPGQNWNPTCVIMDPTVPGKRLIWAAIGGEYYVVHYERGGIAHTFHILVAKLTNNDAKPKVIWTAVGGPLKDYAVFLDALRSGKLDDRLDY
jgi:hypothetical protein